MCSFDVVSIFTDVPIDETVGICLDTFYRSDLEPPKIKEDLLKKLLMKATRDVEFILNDKCSSRLMGSSWGHRWDRCWVISSLDSMNLAFPKANGRGYTKFVDDTFALVESRSSVEKFLKGLNGLHPGVLRFTMEHEENGRLPFMDVFVRREMAGFTTTIYRKPTFTGLYMCWDSYCAMGQTIALIRSLTQRVKKICSAQYLDAEVENLKEIFRKNGYPEPIVAVLCSKPLITNLRSQLSQRSKRKCSSACRGLVRCSAAFGNRIRSQQS